MGYQTHRYVAKLCSMLDERDIEAIAARVVDQLEARFSRRVLELLEVIAIAEQADVSAKPLDHSGWHQIRRRRGIC